MLCQIVPQNNKPVDAWFCLVLGVIRLKQMHWCHCGPVSSGTLIPVLRTGGFCMKICISPVLLEVTRNWMILWKPYDETKASWDWRIVTWYLWSPAAVFGSFASLVLPTTKCGVEGCRPSISRRTVLDREIAVWWFKISSGLEGTRGIHVTIFTS
jgi:hypothetical protein